MIATVVSPDPSRLADQTDRVAETHFTARHSPGRPLIDAAEAAVRQCDELADRLRREADRVANLARTSAKTGIAQEPPARVRDEKAAAKAALHESNGIGKPPGTPPVFAPDSPESMQAWLIQVAQVCGTGHRMERDSTEMSRRRQRIADLREQLVDACPVTRTAKTLSEGLALAPGQRRCEKQSERLHPETHR